MPVALISTSTSTGLRAFELDRHDLQRLARRNRHRRTHVHACRLPFCCARNHRDGTDARASQNAGRGARADYSCAEQGASHAHRDAACGGLAALAVFYFGAAADGRTRQRRRGAASSGCGSSASILNGAVGVTQAGIPLINEIGAFIPIFGIPAGAAWILAYRVTLSRARRRRCGECHAARAHSFASITIWVWVTIAASLPSPRVMRVCDHDGGAAAVQRHASARATSPIGMPAKKLVLLSIVVVRWPGLQVGVRERAAEIVRKAPSRRRRASRRCGC